MRAICSARAIPLDATGPLFLFVACILAFLPRVASLFAFLGASRWACLGFLIGCAPWALGNLLPRRGVRLVSWASTIVGIAASVSLFNLNNASMSLSFIYQTPAANTNWMISFFLAAGLALGLGAVARTLLKRIPTARKTKPAQPAGRLGHAIGVILTFIAILNYGCLNGLMRQLINLPANSICLAMLAVIPVVWIASTLIPQTPLAHGMALPACCVSLLLAIAMLAFGPYQIKAVGYMVEETSALLLVVLLFRSFISCCAAIAQGPIALLAPLLPWLGGLLLSWELMPLYYAGILSSHFLLLFWPASIMAALSIIAALSGVARTATAQERGAPSPGKPTGVQGLAQSCGLTVRETEVLDYLCRGYSLRAIGTFLNISPHTVDAHTRHIYQKAGVHCRDDLMSRAYGLNAYRESNPRSRT